MASPHFIGRHVELETLKRQAKKRIASLIVVRGRRRIGKSTLIEEFSKKYRFYTFVGLAPTPRTTRQSQLDEFASQLTLTFGLPRLYADNWNILFTLLAKQLTKGRVILLLDEISWMGSQDPDFLGQLKNAWDLYFKKNSQLILFICGSSSVWIEKNILSSTAFVGRISHTLTVEDLPLSDCNAFWEGTGSQYSAYDKFKVLSVTGGVPRYLEEIQPEYSAEENIRHLCFSKGALLANEFEKIFSDLFGARSKKYREIVKCLVQGTASYEEICEKLRVEKSGLISEYLNDLVVSGFVTKDYSWNPKTGVNTPLLFKYRLKDNYLRFYLKYIENKLPEIERNSFHLKSVALLPGWASMMGLQFENLVLNNRSFIHQSLRIAPDDIVVENPFFQTKTLKKRACQIDYMIQTRSHVLYVCEIKFSRESVKGTVISEMKEKIDRLMIPRGMSCCPVLIHVNGVSDAVQDSGYFKDIIDFSDLLDRS